MTRVIDLMMGTSGRLIHVALGLALIGYGLAFLGDTAGLVLAAGGLILLGFALSGHCPLELFAGSSRSAPGQDARRAARRGDA